MQNKSVNKATKKNSMSAKLRTLRNKSNNKLAIEITVL